MPEISLSPPPTWTALAATWRALEARSHGSFFQSWSWVGTGVETRFPDPVLLHARHQGQTVALGLFNRRRHLPGGTRLWLNQTGTPALDSIHVEHNGLLIAADAPPTTLANAFAHLARTASHTVLSGVDAAQLAAARATGMLVRDRAHQAAAPWIDLAAVRATPGGHLALLSANTRQQIRRSLRHYALAGPPRLERAQTLDQARSFLAALGALHQHGWTRRGQPGAFANPAFVAFHHDLLATAWPRGEIDLLHIAAGAETLGYLYNFRWHNRTANYQSGFNYAAATAAQQKPGLTCHHLATEMYAAEGLDAYDLLAGESRYKSSLATNSTTLHWIEMMPAWSFPGLLHRARASVKGRLGSAQTRQGPSPWTLKFKNNKKT